MVSGWVIAGTSRHCESFRVRRLPVPAQGHHARCPLVPPIRTLLPRRRRTPGRALHRGRPRHHPPMGPTLHSPTHRRRLTMPPFSQSTVVRRRDLRQVAGKWRYVCSAEDEHGQVIDVVVSRRRDAGRQKSARAPSARQISSSSSTCSSPTRPVRNERRIGCKLSNEATQSSGSP